MPPSAAGSAAVSPASVTVIPVPVVVTVPIAAPIPTAIAVTIAIAAAAVISAGRVRGEVVSALAPAPLALVLAVRARVVLPRLVPRGRSGRGGVVASAGAVVLHGIGPGVRSGVWWASGRVGSRSDG